MRIFWSRILIMVLGMKNQAAGQKIKRIIKKAKLCRQKTSSVKINHTIQEMESLLQIIWSQEDNQWWQTKPKCLIPQKRSHKVEVFCVLVKSRKENFPQFNLANLKHGLESCFLVEENNALTLTRKNKIYSMIKMKIRSSANNPLASQHSSIRKTHKAGNSCPKNLQ